jgi:hypothetical protein
VVRIGENRSICHLQRLKPQLTPPVFAPVAEAAE